MQLVLAADTRDTIQLKKTVFGEDIRVQEVTINPTSEQTSSLCSFGVKRRNKVLFGLALTLVNTFTLLMKCYVILTLTLLLI